MSSIIGKALRGAATVGVGIGIENIRAEIMAKRDAKLEEYAADREKRGYGQEEKLQGTEIKARQDLQTEEIGARKDLQTERIGAEKDLQTSAQKFQVGESAEDRKVTREGQAIERGRLDAQRDEAALDNDLKRIELRSAEEGERFREQYLNATDPAEIMKLNRYLDFMRRVSGESDYILQQKKDMSGGYLDEWIVFDKGTGSAVNIGNAQNAGGDQYEVGKTYVDDEGNKAKYLGNGQWQDL